MKIRQKLTITEDAFAILEAALDADVEVAAVASCTSLDTAAGVAFVLSGVDLIDNDQYLRQANDGLTIPSTAWVPRVRATAIAGYDAAFAHTHPRGHASFSTADDCVDEALAEAFCRITGQDYYLSVVLAGEPGHARAVARVWTAAGGFADLDTIVIAGTRLAFLTDVEHREAARTDRQVRALSRDGDSTLARLHVGVVGMGGTGSPIVEQLLRLGVATITVVDPDVVTETTLSRGAGIGQRHLHRPKADAAEWMRGHIGGPSQVTSIVGDVADPEILAQLATCDLVFGATDNHASRIVLNRFAYTTAIPVIDCGVLVTTTNGVTEVYARVTWLAAGLPCLLCLGRIDPVRAAAEALDPDERVRLSGEGYVPDLAEPDASVVSFATTAAALACSTMVLRVTGIGDHETNEIILDLSGPRILAARRRARQGCYCNAAADLAPSRAA